MIHFEWGIFVIISRKANSHCHYSVLYLFLANESLDPVDMYYISRGEGGRTQMDGVKFQIWPCWHGDLHTRAVQFATKSKYFYGDQIH